MAAALSMLRDECGVLTPKWLPYVSMLPTLAAVWQEVENGHGPQVGARRLKLQRWFWCSSFLGDYDTSPNSQAEGDVSRLRTWLSGGEPPASVSAFQFDCARWFTITAHQRGLYRSTMALLMRHHPLDFHQAKPLTRELIESTGVDDHHVFPAAYQKDQGITGYADTVLNHTMIDKQTNSRIGKKAPSIYIAEMRREIGDQIDTILSSHGLPYETSGPLLQDDYDAFLQWRMNHLKSELAKATS